MGEEGTWTIPTSIDKMLAFVTELHGFLWSDMEVNFTNLPSLLHH